MKARVASTENVWLTIYADMITNLLLLFLALYGLTVMGDDALSKAVLSMKFSDLEKLKSELKKEDFESIPILFRSKLKGQAISITQEAGAIRFELGEGILFASGQAKTKISAENVLMSMADLLKTVPYTIIVEGHTDNVPLLKTSQFKNNRELSSARAMSIVRWFIDKGGISPSQLAAASYGEFKPRSSNLTSAGRRMNRRVDIVLMKEFPFSPKDHVL